MPTDVASSRLRWIAALALAAAAMLLVACGDDDDDSTSAGEASDTQKLAFTISDASPGPTAQGKSSVKGPATAETGLAEITLENTSKLPGGLALIRTTGEHSAAEVVKAVGATFFGGTPTPEWLFSAGGVPETPPGASATVTQLLEPGTYWAVNGPQLQGLPNPRAVPAMKVTGEESDAELPAANTTVTAGEYTFQTEGLKAGKETILFENAGAQPHHLLAFPILKGRTIEDVKAFATSNSGKNPPIDFEAGTGTEVLEGGTSQLVTLDLEKGRYALICFISDRQGGPDHAKKGMVVETEVK